MDQKKMDKAKKKRIKRYITWACMAGLVVLLAAMPLLAKQEAEADGPVASVLSATAQTGSISTALHGGGTLESKDAENVIIPAGVKITEFLVKNGDHVTAGTPVAIVDKVSVMTAITSVNETLEFLEEKLQDARDEKIDSTIKATAGGRVKKIFAQKGESVQEVMLRDGALAVLSIDGLMAVKLEADSNLLTGEAVAVDLPSGEVVTGRIESNLNGIVVVTIEDEGYQVGENVTVTGLGSGTLYIHNAWPATAYSGTIATVHAKEEQTLSSGASLFTLEDTDYTGQLRYRANQHQEYSELLQKLLQMYHSGTITAPCDGIVSGVDKDSTHLLSDSGSDWTPELLDNSGKGNYRIIFLSNSEVLCLGAEANGQECLAETHKEGCPKYCNGTANCGAEDGYHREDCLSLCNMGADCKAKRHKFNCLTQCTGADDPEKCPNTDPQYHLDTCIKRCENIESGNCPSKKHYLTCIESCITSDGSKECPATKSHYGDCIKLCNHASTVNVCRGGKNHYVDCIECCDPDLGKNCPASRHKGTCYFAGMTYTAKAAKVDKADNGNLILFYDATNTTYDVVRSGSSWTIVNGSIDEKQLIARGDPLSDDTAFQSGDIILYVTGTRGDGETWTDVVLYKRTATPQIPGNMGNMDINGLLGGMIPNIDLSAMMGGFSGYGNFFGTPTQQESENLHDLNGSTLMTITPQETVVVTMTIDEHDIAKVPLGAEATIEIMALKDQVFPATVTRIGTNGSNNGGSSKFEVELTSRVSSQALIGMSVTGQIPLESQENVTIVPLAALVEDGAKTLVYTAQDPKTGDPLSPVEVETGLSDGENVEILTGLNPGDTVFYFYYDTVEMDHSAVANKVTFG